ncbi:MAG: ankyrin repeat domain-containing protein [Lactobacillales bacterium]|jgi:ankyrin repeat protein|nr:ankyrin repeat domain-containing protein [Lactobacillales bacterium]
MDLKIKKTKYIIFIAVICFLGMMVFAGDKVHAKPEEYTCKKKTAVGDLQSRMGLKSKKAFQTALNILGISTNGNKFTGSTTKTIIFDADNKTVKLKDKIDTFFYDVQTGELTPMKVLKPYESYSKEELIQSLYSAICENEPSEVRQILATGKININEPLYNGWTPLQVAVDLKKPTIVDCLLTFPDINVNGKGGIGRPPLYIAAQKGYGEIVQSLLAYGGAIDEPNDKDGSTPLFIAVQNDNVDATQILIDAGANGDITCEQGFSPFHFAVQEGKLKFVQMLLSREGCVDINKPTDLCGITPVFLALRKNNLPLVKMLIAKHADLNIPDKEGFHPLDYAVQEENLEAVELILAAGLEQIDINRRYPYGGCTPLHRAICMNQSDEISLKLIKSGADLTVKADGGFTPFFAAVQNKKPMLMKVLFKKDNSVVNEPNDQGYTPINFAAEKGLPNVVNRLIELDADPNRPNNNGHTPLFRAVFKKHFEVAKILVDCRGINLDCPIPTSDSHITPLLFAIGRGYNDFAQLLINAGSNINGIAEINEEAEAREHNLAETPLRVAIRGKNVPVIESILSHKNSNFTYDYMGNTIELLQAIGVDDHKVVAAVLKSEKIHITDYALDCAGDENVKAVVKEKLESLNPAEEESEQEWEEPDEEEEEDVQSSRPNPLLDQAEVALPPAFPVRRPSLTPDYLLLEMVVPLEQQITSWRILNRFLHREKPLPLQIDVHTRSAVLPKVYVRAVLDKLCILLAREAYSDVKVILITGRGNHSRNQGFSKLKVAVLEIAKESFNVQETGNLGRLLLNFKDGRFI